MSLKDRFFIGTKLYHKLFLELFRPLAQYLGLSHGIYVRVDRRRHVFSICSHPAWIERMLEEHYYLLTPLMLRPDHMPSGFYFDAMSPEWALKKAVLHEASTQFHWCNSFAYVERTPGGGYFAFDFGTAKENVHVASRLANEARLVQKVIRALHQKLLLRLKNFKIQTMDLSVLKAPCFISD